MELRVLVAMCEAGSLMAELVRNNSDQEIVLGPASGHSQCNALIGNTIQVSKENETVPLVRRRCDLIEGCYRS